MWVFFAHLTSRRCHILDDIFVSLWSFHLPPSHWPARMSDSRRTAFQSKRRRWRRRSPVAEAIPNTSIMKMSSAAIADAPACHGWRRRRRDGPISSREKFTTGWDEMRLKPPKTMRRRRQDATRTFAWRKLYDSFTTPACESSFISSVCPRPHHLTWHPLLAGWLAGWLVRWPIYIVIVQWRCLLVMFSLTLKSSFLLPRLSTQTVTALLFYLWYGVSWNAQFSHLAPSKSLKVAINQRNRHFILAYSIFPSADTVCLILPARKAWKAFRQRSLNIDLYYTKAALS